MAVVVNAKTGDRIEVPDGTSLQAVAGDLEVALPCRTAHCRSCVVDVKEGGENLVRMKGRERMALENANFPESCRFLCTAKIISGEVVVETGPKRIYKDEVGTPEPQHVESSDFASLSVQGMRSRLESIQSEAQVSVQ